MFHGIPLKLCSVLEAHPIHPAPVSYHFLRITFSLYSKILMGQTIMKMKPYSAPKRQTHIPEMQLHMSRAVPKVEETDSPLIAGQLLKQDK